MLSASWTALYIPEATRITSYTLASMAAKTSRLPLFAAADDMNLPNSWSMARSVFNAGEGSPIEAILLANLEMRRLMALKLSVRFEAFTIPIASLKLVAAAAAVLSSHSIYV